jgi:hypothetical protein
MRQWSGIRGQVSGALFSATALLIRDCNADGNGDSQRGDPCRAVLQNGNLRDLLADPQPALMSGACQPGEVSS